MKNRPFVPQFANPIPNRALHAPNQFSLGLSLPATIQCMCSKSHSHSPLNVSLPFDFAAAVCTKIFHGYYRRMDTALKHTNTLAKTSQGERQLHTNMRPMHIGAGKRKRNLFRSGSCFPTNTFSFLNIFYVYESCKKCTARTNQGIGSACTFSYSVFYDFMNESVGSQERLKSVWRWSICSDSLLKLRPWQFLLFRLCISQKKWDHNAILFCPSWWGRRDKCTAGVPCSRIKRHIRHLSTFLIIENGAPVFCTQAKWRGTKLLFERWCSLESTMEIYIVNLWRQRNENQSSSVINIMRMG